MLLSPSNLISISKSQVAQSYPYVKNRFALVGDAAHTTHPLAGQGFNLALGDVAALVARVERAVHSGEDVGSHAVLSDYQRDRLARNTFSLAGIDALQKIFSVRFEPFVIARGIGMTLVDKVGPLKSILSKFAIGK
jgi:2-polyprenyl-6-methoxyphenol hydroxylase-like FAD-dependent oxidoreductase